MPDVIPPTIAGADATARPATESGPLLVRAEVVAGLLSISRSTLYEWRRDGRILDPAVESGRVVLWSRPELDAWIAAGCPSADDWRRSRRVKR